MNIPILGHFTKARDKPTNSYNNYGHTYLFGQTTSGKPVNEYTECRPQQCSCVRILSEAIASLPLHIYRYKADGKEKVYDRLPIKISIDSGNKIVTIYDNGCGIRAG